MTFKRILAGTALAALTLFTGAALPSGMFAPPSAEAAVNISFSVFYDELAPHGDWVRHQDAYVFIPANVGPDWRPYTRGHWVYAERYGWTWASDEPFGWATYHYGRWGYGEDIGWYWVPGTRWAPAWVSWRRSNDYIVWAPLPPSRGDADVSVSITVGDIPDYYWVAVPAREFLSVDIHVVVVKEEREIKEVIERTEFVGAPRITNNIVVNNVIDVDVVAKATGKEVKAVKVKETADPREASASEDAVTVFEGEIAPDEAAKPKDVRDAAKVKKVKRGNEGEAAGTQPIPEPDGTEAATEAPVAKPAKPAAKTAEEPEVLPEATPQKPAKKQAEEQVEEPADEATGTTEPPKVKGEQKGKAKDEQQKKKAQDKKDCDPADPECQPVE